VGTMTVLILPSSYYGPGDARRPDRTGGTWYCPPPEQESADTLVSTSQSLGSPRTQPQPQLKFKFTF
jgi:hypothetical protein